MKKCGLFLIIIGTMVLFLAGCGNKSEVSEAAAVSHTPKDTITMAITEDLMSMDPQETNRLSNFVIQQQVYNSLVSERNDGSGIVDPELATEWSWIDDTTLNIKLRDDVYFHNGTKLTAKDVYFTIEKGKNTSRSKSTFSSFDIENTEIVNDYEINIKFFEPYAPVFNTLSGGRGLIVSKDYFDEVGADVAARKPVGTGPYKLVNWTSGTQLDLEANEDYWDTAHKAKTKNIILKVVSAQSSRAIELETGTSDLAFELATGDVKRVNELEGYHADVSPSFRYMTLTFSMQDETLASNKALRYALSYAIDRQAIIDAIYGGNAMPATGMYPHNAKYFKKFDDFMPYDLDKAREYMAEAGYPDGGLKLLFNCEDRTYDKMMAEAIQAMWKDIGVETEIIVGSSSVYKSQGHPFQIAMRAGNGAEPANILIIYDSAFGDKIGGNDNYIDEQLALDRAILDPEKRSEAYKSLQEYLYDIRFTVPLIETSIIFGLSDKIEGFVSDPLQSINFNDLVLYN